jgi:hypothetical protein
MSNVCQDFCINVCLMFIKTFVFMCNVENGCYAVLRHVDQSNNFLC